VGAKEGEEEVLARGQKPPEMNLPGFLAPALPAVSQDCWRLQVASAQLGGRLHSVAGGIGDVSLSHPFARVASRSWGARQHITGVAELASPCG